MGDLTTQSISMKRRSRQEKTVRISAKREEDKGECLMCGDVAGPVKQRHIKNKIRESQ